MLRKKIFACPYLLGDCELNKNSFSKTRKIQPACLNNDSFVSKTFYIRYCEEEAILNEYCLFRTEITSFPELADSRIYFECDLHFCERTKDGNDEENFNKVASYKAQINNYYKGVFEYLCVSFDEIYFSLADVSVLSILYDFRIKNSLMDDMETPKNPIKFEDYLGKITQDYDVRHLDHFYTKYVGGLKKNYFKMSTLYNRLTEYLKSSSEPFDPSIFKTKAELKDLEYNTIGKISTEFLSTKTELSTEIHEEKKTSVIPFSKTIDFNDKDFRLATSKGIQKESNVIASQLFELLYDYIDLLQKCSDNVIDWLKGNYEEAFREKFSSFIQDERVCVRADKESRRVQ